MMNDCLIIKCNKNLPKMEYNKLREHIKNQVESGVVLLPPYCDALLVPKDTVVAWMNNEGFPVIDARGEEDD